MTMQGYYLGCPAWGFKEWVGNLYPCGTRPAKYLREYASVFNTVEGNTTFYSLPTAETVARWKDATSDEFRFCFKFPQTITHRKLLRYAEPETEEFLDRMEPLRDLLGPFMIQLPPIFGPEHLRILDHFLSRLPDRFRYAVELRHPAFYATPDDARCVESLLERRGCERVIMDTRPLRSGDDQHPGVLAARHRKPNLPVEPVALGPHPIVRLIGHPEMSVNRPWIEAWCEILSRWLGDGRAPYLFIHCPDNTYAPSFARDFHAQLETVAEVGEMPKWPGESGQLSLL